MVPSSWDFLSGEPSWMALGISGGEEQAIFPVEAKKYDFAETKNGKSF